MLSLPAQNAAFQSKNNAVHWAQVTKGFEFSGEDRVDPMSFDRVLWHGLKGNQLYPGDANLAQTRALYKKALMNAAASRIERDDH
jgi:hypothetical protein